VFVFDVGSSLLTFSQQRGVRLQVANMMLTAATSCAATTIMQRLSICCLAWNDFKAYLCLLMLQSCFPAPAEDVVLEVRQSAAFNHAKSAKYLQSHHWLACFQFLQVR
jgi:hypothetical protein